MPRNVEIKAEIDEIEVVMRVAELLAGKSPELIEQEDVFFHTINGRLKLRFLKPTKGQLIFYQRDDVRGPKTCTYHLVEIDHPGKLRSLLAVAYGEKIVVRKSRYLYLVGRTRIHIDKVEDLGNFLELEVVLEDGEPPHIGENEALKLMEKLGLNQGSLVEGAYADLLADLS